MKPSLLIIVCAIVAVSSAAGEFKGAVIAYDHYTLCNPYADPAKTCKSSASSKVVLKANGDRMRHDKRPGSVRTVKDAGGKQTIVVHEVKMKFTVPVNFSAPILSPAEKCQSPISRFVKESQYLGLKVYYSTVDLQGMHIDEWRAPDVQCEPLITRMQRKDTTAPPQTVLATSVKLGPIPPEEWNLPAFPEVDPMELDREVNVQYAIRAGRSRGDAERDYEDSVKQGKRRDYEELSRRWKHAH